MILYWLLLITVGTNTEQIHKVFPPARRLLVALSVCRKVEIAKISTIMTFGTYLSQPRLTVDYISISHGLGLPLQIVILPTCTLLFYTTKSLSS
jgi:hypothetical protein